MQKSFDVDESDAFDRLYDFIKNVLNRGKYIYVPPVTSYVSPVASYASPEEERGSQELEAVELGLELKRLESVDELSAVRGKSLSIAKIVFALCCIPLLYTIFWLINDSQRVIYRIRIRNEHRRYDRAAQTYAGARELRVREAAAVDMIRSDLYIMRAAAELYALDRGTMLTSIRPLLPYLAIPDSNRPNRFDDPVYRTRIESRSGGRPRWWVGIDLEAAGWSEGVRERLGVSVFGSTREEFFSEPRQGAVEYSRQGEVWTPALRR